MFTVSAIFAGIATVLYAGRTGDVWDLISVWGKLGRVGITSVLGTLAVGLFQRELADAPFIWIHWLVFGAVLTTASGYAGVMWERRKNRRPDAPTRFLI